MQEEYKIIEANWKTAFKTWWWFTWRTFVTLTGIAIVVSLILGFVLNIESDVIESLPQFVKPIIGFAICVLILMINFYFFKKVSSKSFKSFSLSMKQDQISQKNLLAIWWWFTWRALVTFGIIVFIIVSLSGVNIVTTDLGGESGFILDISTFILSNFINFYFFKKVLNKQFRQFSLMLTRHA